MNIVCLDLEGVLVPEVWIAFSTGFNMDVSQGWITIVRGSGTEMLPTC